MSESRGEDKLEKIKREGASDASSYYAQGEKEEHDLKSEYGKPLPPIDSEEEEFNLVRTLSYLAFAGAALALVFILFFINKKVDNVGKEVGDLTPFKKEVGLMIVKLSTDLDKLKSGVEQHDRSTMIMELRRALLTVEGVTANSSPEIKNKSAQAVAGIQLLLDELGAGTKAATVTEAPGTEAKPEGAAPVAGASLTEVKPAEGVAPAAGASPTEVKPAEGVAPAAGASPTEVKPVVVSGAPATETKPAESAGTPAVASGAKIDAAPIVVAPKGAVPNKAKKKKSASADDDDEDD